MRLKYFLHGLAMSILLSVHAHSQTATISYINAPLPEICNTFNGGGAPYKVGGYEHYPYSGGVLYNHNDSAISLKTQLGNTTATTLGTAYAIRYPFKEGYAYKIQMIAWQFDPSQGAIHLSFSLINQLPTADESNPIPCYGVSRNYWARLQGSQLAGTYIENNKNPRDIVSFTADQAYNYLTVLASQGASAGSWAYIRQIVITEAPPAYTLAPASLSKMCGTGVSQTFTITDVHNSGKVISYVWDLGSDNNGWLYNGIAAPRSITTVSPSLTLTADACGVPSNVTATVTRSSGSYATNPSVVTTTNPATLSGPSESCGGTSIFTVSDLTCGDITWSLSPGAIGTLSNTTGPSTTLTTPAQSQGLMVIANITSTCGNKTISKLFEVLSKPKNFSIGGDPQCQEGRIIPLSYFFASPEGTDPYYWSWRSSSGSAISLPYRTAEFYHKFAVGSYTLSAYAENICGRSDVATLKFNINQCSFAASEPENVSVAVLPNPASNVVVVTTNITNGNAKRIQEIQDIREIRILDKTGTLLRKQSFPTGTTRTTINVENLKSDLYILQIGDGKKFESRKIRISR